jgi:SAM-dependent methyltransferase
MSKKLLPKGKRFLEFVSDEYLSRKYNIQGRNPWTPGYLICRDKLISQVVSSPDNYSVFKSDTTLPENYGVGFDERVIEYPWVFSRLSSGGGRLLDAGGTLSYPYLVSSPAISYKKIFVYTLEPNGPIINSPNMSYVYGDLRDTIFRDELFDEIVCISTLEHVGLDNKIYSSDPSFREAKTKDFLKVIKEFSRILHPKGKLLITVPFGRYENHGWFQQFDISLIEELISSFRGTLVKFSVYKYEFSGWKLSDADECVECSYSDILADRVGRNAHTAAASAVACLEMDKTN